MSFTDAIKTCFKKYISFTGRAPRPEFWWFVLFMFVGNVALTMVYDLLGALFGLATLLPFAAVTCRRLHDIAKSGWWMFLPAVGVVVMLLGMWMGIQFLAYAGMLIVAGLNILLIVWYCKRGDAEANRFGPPPLPSAEPAAQPA
jgi:uncharacterized membrane protein YhaH (DUF805 family)